MSTLVLWFAPKLIVHPNLNQIPKNFDQSIFNSPLENIQIIFHHNFKLIP